MSDKKCPTCGGDEFDARPGNPKRCCNCGWTSDDKCPDCGTRMGTHRRSEYAEDGGLEFEHTEARCLARQLARLRADLGTANSIIDKIAYKVGKSSSVADEEILDLCRFPRNTEAAGKESE